MTEFLMISDTFLFSVTEVHNDIGNKLFERIMRAYKQKETFR